MRTGYRSFSTIDTPDIDPFLLTRQQIVSWLRHKRLNADLLADDGATQLSADTVAWRGSMTTQDGRRIERCRLTEDRATGTWTTTLTVSARQGTSWLLVDVGHEPKLRADGTPSARPIHPLVPNLIKQLGEAADLSDGLAILRHEPEILPEDRVDDLINVLCSPQRRGPVFVAGSDESLPLDRWRRLVAKLVKETVGLAATYVLTPDATRALSASVGQPFAVDPGAIRTYLNEVDPAVDDDARRHRILSTHAVATRSTSSVISMLGVIARNQTLERPLPRDVQRQLVAFDRKESLLLVEQAPLDAQEPNSIEGPAQDIPGSAAGAAAPDSRSLLRMDGTAISTVKRLLGVANIRDIPNRLAKELSTSEARAGTIRELLARNEDATSTLDEQRQTIESLRAALEDAELDGGVEAETNGRLRDRLAHTQVVLAEATSSLQRYADFDGWARIYEPFEPATAPEDLDEVLERFDEMANLQFTGRLIDVYDLRDRDTVGTFASKTWSALHSLNDYVRAKNAGAINGDLWQYIENTPAGYVGMSSLQLALAESESVSKNPKFRRQRMLPVPTSVNPDGRVYMEAHVKLGRAKSICPRLYFYDDVAKSGKIYVGYIGCHMANTRTN